MKTIYKYPIPPNHHFSIMMPRGAYALHAGPQNNRVFVWAVVDTEQPEEEVLFQLVGTGQHHETDGWRHVSTWLMESGQLVWHLFQATQ